MTIMVLREKCYIEGLDKQLMGCGVGGAGWGVVSWGAWGAWEGGDVGGWVGGWVT